MKVLVAGASGAIGRPLVGQLVAGGHDVVGTTRREDRASALRDLGAEAAICDMLDPAQVRRTLEAVRPDVVIDELTSLPADYDVRRKDLYDATNRIRSEGTAALLEASLAVGVRRYVIQSIAVLYAPEGDWVKDEDAAVWTDAPRMFQSALGVLLANERKVAGSDSLEGLVLRYGFFYGPGTYLAPDGSLADQVRKRRFPVVGRGDGTTSFIHVADAAAATVAAAERGAPGIYNVSDDNPAPLREWLPEYARAVGAKPPRRVPAWIARLVAGGFAQAMASQLRGASNAKAKRELGWSPVVPDWREGFHSCLDSDPPVPDRSTPHAR